MDCSICKTSQTPFPVDEETAFPVDEVTAFPICVACYEGARNIMNFINKFETENGNAEASTSTHSPTSPCKSLMNASKWIVDLTKEQSFFLKIADVYRKQTPSDIPLKPGNIVPSLLIGPTSSKIKDFQKYAGVGCMQSSAYEKYNAA